MSVKVLIVSYYFDPCNLTSSQRSTRLASFLAGRGADPAVVTVAPEFYGRSRWEGDGLRTSLRVHEVPWRGVYGALQRLGRPGGIACNALLQRAFRGAVLRALEAGPRPDFTYWWGVPFWYFPLAPGISRRTGIPYVLDFVDVWHMAGVRYRIDQRSGLRALIDGPAEARSVRDAALVVTTTDAQTEFYRARYPAMASDRFMTVLWGYDAGVLRSVRPARPPQGVFRIVLIGRFSAYSMDETRLLARAVAEFARGGPVEFQHLGRPEPELEAAFRDAGCGDLLVQRGMLPYGEAMRVVAGAGCTVQNPMSDVSISVKTYDAIGLRRPILAFAPAGCALARVLASYPPSTVVQDAEGAVSFLEALRAGRVQGAGDFPVADYSVQHQFGRFIDRLEELKAADGEGA